MIHAQVKAFDKGCMEVHNDPHRSCNVVNENSIATVVCIFPAPCPAFNKPTIVTHM